ncbi:unnamed protein product [Brassica rapa subsp. trilocularis]
MRFTFDLRAIDAFDFYYTILVRFHKRQPNQFSSSKHSKIDSSSPSSFSYEKYRKLIKASFMSPCCIYVESPSLVMPSVMHGDDYARLGFLFGEKSRVAYIFDVSRFPLCTEYIISKSGGGQLDLLNLDTSFKTLETIEFPCTKRGLLGRMTHEFDHHKDNECLEEWSNRKERTDLQRSAGNLAT